MVDEVKLYVVVGSPFVCRVKIALNLKGIKYEMVEEDVNNKSVNLLKYNPIHKKVPVLVHNGNPLTESLVIVEYIDDVWEGVSILPRNPYEKALARYWVKFIDAKCLRATFKVFGSKGNEQAIGEAWEQLQILENELTVKGKKFFGGENINVVDISATFLAHWLEAIEEVTKIKVMSNDKFPKLTQWANDFVNHQVVKEVLCPRQNIVAYFKKRFSKM